MFTFHSSTRSLLIALSLLALLVACKFMNRAFRASFLNTVTRIWRSDLCLMMFERKIIVSASLQTNLVSDGLQNRTLKEKKTKLAQCLPSLAHAKARSFTSG